MNYREKMREYLKEPNQLSSQYGKWGILNREQRQMINRLLDEMDRADIYIKELFLKNERLNNVLNELEKLTISICKNCYEDRETERIKKRINELKESDK